jgi:hypothetical protein
MVLMKINKKKQIKKLFIIILKKTTNHKRYLIFIGIRTHTNPQNSQQSKSTTNPLSTNPKKIENQQLNIIKKNLLFGCLVK